MPNRASANEVRVVFATITIRLASCAALPATKFLMTLNRQRPRRTALKVLGVQQRDHLLLKYPRSSPHKARCGAFSARRNSSAGNVFDVGHFLCVRRQMIRSIPPSVPLRRSPPRSCHTAIFNIIFCSRSSDAFAVGSERLQLGLGVVDGFENFDIRRMIWIGFALAFHECVDCLSAPRVPWLQFLAPGFELVLHGFRFRPSDRKLAGLAMATRTVPCTRAAGPAPEQRPDQAPGRAGSGWKLRLGKRTRGIKLRQTTLKTSQTAENA